MIRGGCVNAAHTPDRTRCATGLFYSVFICISAPQGRRAEISKGAVRIAQPHEIIF